MSASVRSLSSFGSRDTICKGIGSLRASPSVPSGRRYFTAMLGTDTSPTENAAAS